LATEEDANGEEIYRGQKGYRSYLPKNQTPSLDKDGEEKDNRYLSAPKKIPTNVKASVRFDFQPHVCKDYKETGTCGFGDSCIFLHDRGDYKSGWELDREWEIKKGKPSMNSSSSSQFYLGDSNKEDGEEEPSYLCPICQCPFTNPVSTKCKHYFCEKCALKRHASSFTTCFVCQSPTGGSFKPAKDLVDEINSKTKALEEQRKQVEQRMQEEHVSTAINQEEECDD